MVRSGPTTLCSLLLAPLLFLPERCSGVPGAYGPLDVRTFGAKGDGVSDDAAAIQKAIDQAQQVSSLGSAGGPSRPVYFPAGLYLVNSSLTIVSTHKKDALPLRLYGDGVGQTVIMAGAEMDAVLRFESYGPSGGVPGMTTNGHTIESMKFDAAAKANYSVAATAITRSLFRYSDFSGARIAGLFLGYGWINDILECYFTGNLIGLYLDNAVNSVNCVDGNFEGNYGVGIVVNSGAMVRLEGNEFESQGGPGIIVNSVSALTVRSNYFEANNQGFPPGNGSKVLSYVDHHSGAQEQVCTDILLNGYPTWGPERSNGKNPLVAAGPDGKLVFAPIPLSNEQPCSGVVIAANSHSPGHDFCPGNEFAGVFAAGADGLSATASNAGGCVGGSKRYHYAEVVLDKCGDQSSCGGKNMLWTALSSEAVKGEYIFQSALQGSTKENKCYVLNIPEDLSLGGFQVVAYGAAQCPTSSDQCSFKVGATGQLKTSGFRTSKCDTTDGCCVQAGQLDGNSTSLVMAKCSLVSTLQQFEVDNLDGKPGQIRDKASGQCLAVKNCELETAPSSGKPARTCVAVATGNAPDANSSLADMDIRLNTGDFAANK